MTRRTEDFQTLHSEGGLLPADLLRRLLEPAAKVPGTQPADYGLPPGERLNETITQSWNRLRRHWAAFRTAAANLAAGEAGTGLTNDQWSLPLLRELGFGWLPTSPGPVLDGRTYPINRFSGPTPIHLVGCGLSLDRRAAGVKGAAAVNPHGLVQEFLNRSPGHLWAVLGNGLRLRVLRDNQALSRQSYLEFDLEAMFAGEVYADFVVLWRVAHATRFAPLAEGKPESCWLEQWTRLANEQGTRALGDLRQGVEQALHVLGQGLVGHPRNVALREALRSGRLTPSKLHGQLLRVVYRLIFLFVAEDRTLDGVSLLHPRDDSEAGRLARERYAAHYSTARLRRLAASIKGSHHGDLWQQFNGLVGALSGEERFAAAREALALPALGSLLWNPASTADLNAASLTGGAGAELSNADLLAALRQLAFTRQGSGLRPVDYCNLGAEELGGVYESLLALTPRIEGDGARFTFAEFAGNERKTSGSYYTPDALVQCLLDSALDPVVAAAIAGKTGAEAEQAILALKVCDPAVGSGHFLVGAAHRLARHLARVWAQAQGESEPSPLLYQTALREVISRCLYGVDLNPMAAELCRVNLWLEALEPGKPLSFLEHHIRVGNSLLGATPALIAQGIPDEAFKPIAGDDPAFCREYRKQNKRERDSRTADLFGHGDEPWERLGNLAVAMSELEDLDEDTVAGVQTKQARYEELVRGAGYLSGHLLADAWCAAFVWQKRQAPTLPYPITDDLLRKIEQNPYHCPPWIRDEIERLARQYQFFHWHLEFPSVFGPMGEGGFDVVLGNPPWVRQEMLKPIKQLLPKFRSFTSMADSSVYFLELSVLICRPLGRVAMLTPNKWFRASYAENLREFLRQRCRVDLLIDFGHSRNLFPDADTFPAAVIFLPVASTVPDSETARFVQAHDFNREHYSLSELTRVQAIAVPHRNLRRDQWHLEDSRTSDLLDRLMTAGQPLASLLRRPILSGVKTGFNQAFYIETPLRNAIIASDPISEPLFKKFLRGRDVKRWVPLWDDQWHIVIPSSQNRTWPWSNAANEAEAEAIFAATHPSIHIHLKQYEKLLRARQDKGQYWWELRACDYYDDLEKPKIVVQVIAYYSQFSFDIAGYYISDKSIFIPTDDVFLLAILNSRLIWWILNRTLQHMKDDGLNVSVHYVRRLPVPTVPKNLHTDILKLAHKLVTVAALPADEHSIAPLEIRLNDLVEQAFALTDAERRLLVSSLPPRDPIQILETT